MAGTNGSVRWARVRACQGALDGRHQPSKAYIRLRDQIPVSESLLAGARAPGWTGAGRLAGSRGPCKIGSPSFSIIIVDIMLRPARRTQPPLRRVAQIALFSLVNAQ